MPKPDWLLSSHVTDYKRILPPLYALAKGNISLPVKKRFVTADIDRLNLNLILYSSLLTLAECSDQ